MNDSTRTTDAGDTLLKMEGVGKTYQMGQVAVEVLRNISLDIRRGEFLALVGPSGSGKSTILNILGGMDSPTVGRVWYDGKEITFASSAELTRLRREEIGFVFQFYNLVPNLTARENVMVATEIADDPLGVDESLQMVGLEARSDHFPSQMSGGEQQRVAIARALAKNPTLVLCDEPTGALDFATGIKVLRLLYDVNRNTGKTVLLITHNTAIAAIAHRVVHLRSGEITEVAVNRQPALPEEVAW